MTEQALLEAIWAEPDADAPRAVYADYLLGIGDPRGVFVQRQLARATEGQELNFERTELPPEELELLKTHEARWFGAAFPAMVEGAPERGFYRQIRVSSRGDRTAQLVDALGLNTVRHAAIQRGRIRSHAGLRQVLGCDGLRHLDRVGRLLTADLKAFERSAARPRWIEMARPATLSALPDVLSRIPAVERLDVYAHPDDAGALGGLEPPALGLWAPTWLARDAGFESTPVPRSQRHDRLHHLLETVSDRVARIVLVDADEAVAMVRRDGEWALDLGTLVDRWPTYGDPRFASVSLLEALPLPVALLAPDTVYRTDIREPMASMPAHLPPGPLRVDGGYLMAREHFLDELPALPEIQFAMVATRWLRFADRTPRFARVRLLRADGTLGPLLSRGEDGRLRYASPSADTVADDLERIESSLGRPLHVVSTPP